MNPELSQYLDFLADGILPLTDWISSKPYVPPNAEALPWRMSSPVALRPSQLGFLNFLEGLLNESSGDEELKVYFSTRAEDPLTFAPQDDVSAWRALRGLSPSPNFGVVESDNLLIDVEGHPISRIAFYRTYLPLFEYASRMATISAGEIGVNWKEFSKSLLTNASPFWPKSLPRRSSTFVKQFGRDLLYAVLGMRNPVPEPWRDAVLIELGEHRRIGNAFNPEDASSVLEAFQVIFDPLFDNGGATPSHVEDSMFSAVGSPPVTPREQQV
jgi:hypothetical protein